MSEQVQCRHSNWRQLPAGDFECWGCSKVIQRLELTIRAERDDTLPAFGGFLRCEPNCPGQHEHGPTMILNVAAIMAPVLEYEDGSPAPQSEADRKMLLITTIMHEVGHALEQHLGMPVNESALDDAIAEWERAWFEANNSRATQEEAILPDKSSAGPGA